MTSIAPAYSQIFSGVSAGIKNALAYPAFLQVFRTDNPKIRKILLQSVLTSLGLALAALLMYLYLEPFVMYIGSFFGAGRPSLWGKLMTGFFKLGYFGSCYLPWMVACFQLSSMFCRKITSEIVSPGSTSTPAATPSEEKKLPMNIAVMIVKGIEAAIGMVPIIVVIVELSLLQMIPYIGSVVSSIARALYYSYVIWTFKWNEVSHASPGTEVNARMSFVQQNWPYFVGYSLPLVIFTAILPAKFISTWAYATVLPIWVILTHYAAPPPVTTAPASTEPTKTAPFALPLFSLPITAYRRASAYYESIKEKAE